MKESIEERGDMDKQPGYSNNTDLALKLVGFSLLAILALLLIYQLKALIACLILAATLSSAIAPVAELAQKKKIPRIVTILALYLIAAISYSFIGSLLIPAIHEQWQKFNENLPAYVFGIDQWYQHALNLAGNKADALVFSVEDMRTLVLKLLRQTLDMSAGVFGLILNSILILFLAAYFVVEADKIWATILKWLPQKAAIRIAPLIVPLTIRMGGYVRGQLLAMLAVGLFLAVGFTILGVKYALLLAVLGGILNLVPYIGSITATVCAVIVAFNQTPLLAGAVLLFYSFEQWSESSFIIPILLGKQVALHPLIILFAILCGATVMGIPGVLISVPVTSAAIFLAEEFYVKAKDNANAHSATSEISKQTAKSE